MNNEMIAVMSECEREDIRRKQFLETLEWFKDALFKVCVFEDTDSIKFNAYFVPRYFNEIVAYNENRIMRLTGYNGERVKLNPSGSRTDTNIIVNKDELYNAINTLRKSLDVIRKTDDFDTFKNAVYTAEKMYLSVIKYRIYVCSKNV